MNKLLLVQPTRERSVDPQYSASTLEEFVPFLPEGKLKSHLKSKKAVNVPSLSLMILAALTPWERFEVELVDEKVEPIDYDCGADLVAITASTTIAYHAYEIAKEFRKRGAKVVMGGMHASVLPDEVLQHVDAVVVGEAEYVWPNVLSDFSRGKLEGRYQSARLIDMQRDYVIPDNSVLKKEHYMFETSLEISRGCPHTCLFCSGDIIHGNKYRTRDLGQVIDQIEQTESDFLFFADDNIIGNRGYARELFRELKRMDKRWVSSASTKLAEDPELMDLAIESGCRFLIVGFESLSEEALKQLGKNHNNVKRYGDFVRYMQDNGVVIAASFILGHDGETRESVQRLCDYAEDEGIWFFAPGVLTPYPGTPLFEMYKREGRLLHEVWDRYNVRYGPPVFACEEDTARCIEEAVKYGGKYHFFRQLIKQPSIIERFAN